MKKRDTDETIQKKIKSTGNRSELFTFVNLPE
jgi:hypothetical protein